MKDITYPTLGDFLAGHDFSNGVVMLLIMVIIVLAIPRVMKRLEGTRND